MKQLCLPVLKNRQSFAISNSPDERVQSGPVLCASVKCHLLIAVCVMTHAPFISASQVFFFLVVRTISQLLDYSSFEGLFTSSLPLSGASWQGSLVVPAENRLCDDCHWASKSFLQVSYI